MKSLRFQPLSMCLIVALIAAGCGGSGDPGGPGGPSGPSGPGRINNGDGASEDFCYPDGPPDDQRQYFDGQWTQIGGDDVHQAPEDYSSDYTFAVGSAEQLLFAGSQTSGFGDEEKGDLFAYYFDGNEWEELPDIAGSDIAADAIKSTRARAAAVDDDGTPYIALQVNASALYTGEMPILIKKWNGDAWITLGEEFLGAKNDYDDLLIDDSGRLIALMNGQVYAWENDTWTPLGEALDADISNIQYHQSMVIKPGPDGQLLAGLLTRVANRTDELYIKLWDGQSWETLGGVVMETDGTEYRLHGPMDSGPINVAFGPDNTPYLLVNIEFSEDSSPPTRYAYIYRWTGTSWESLPDEKCVFYRRELTSLGYPTLNTGQSGAENLLFDYTGAPILSIPGQLADLIRQLPDGRWMGEIGGQWGYSKIYTDEFSTGADIQSPDGKTFYGVVSEKGGKYHIVSYTM